MASLHSDLYLGYLPFGSGFCHCQQVVADCIRYVGESLFTCCTLRPAAREGRAGYTESLFGFRHDDSITQNLHAPMIRQRATAP